MKISVNLTLVVGKIDMWATPYMKFLNKLENHGKSYKIVKIMIKKKHMVIILKIKSVREKCLRMTNSVLPN